MKRIESISQSCTCDIGTCRKRMNDTRAKINQQASTSKKIWAWEALSSTTTKGGPLPPPKSLEAKWLVYMFLNSVLFLALFNPSCIQGYRKSFLIPSASIHGSYNISTPKSSTNRLFFYIQLCTTQKVSALFFFFFVF